MRWRLFWTRTPNHQPRMLWSAPDQRDPDRIPDRIPDRMSDTMSICQKECQNIEYAIICNIYFQAVCENYVRIVCQVLDHSTKVIYGTPLEPWQLRAAEKAPVPSWAAARFPSRAQEGLGAWYVPDVPGFGDEFCLLVASWVYDIHEYNLRIYIYVRIYIYYIHNIYELHIFSQQFRTKAFLQTSLFSPRKMGSCLLKLTMLMFDATAPKWMLNFRQPNHKHD